jgi:hypothetical protein
MNYEKMPEVEYRKVDLSQAESLCQSVRKYSQIQVLPLLEQIFEYFGVEVEDFDTQGNIKATASSLMFVESFPGLGPDGEKVFTENRSLALVRNDLAFINVDSPDFYEIIQFYLNSDLGRLSAIVAQEDSWNFAALLAGDKMCVVVDSQKHSLEKWLEKNTLDTVIVPKATQVQQYEKILIPLLERIQSSNPSFRVEAMLLNIT